MRDQADKLRQLVRKTIKEHPRLEPGVPFVVLNGGNAGVGTSTVAIQLVQELAQLGKRAVLVDANPKQPDIAAQLGIEARGSLADVLDGRRSVVEVLEPINDSVCLLAGRWAPNSPPEINHEAVSRLLTELRRLHAKADVAIIDAGSGMSPWATQLWRAAHQVLLVTTPDSDAVTDSYATVKLSPYVELAEKLRLVVNRCDDHHTAQQIGNRFATTCQQFLGIDVGETITVASNTATDAPGRIRIRTSRLNNAFEQSVRLLAADVLSSCLVLSSSKQSRRVGFSRSSFKASEKQPTTGEFSAKSAF
ncbi:MAG: MinD/ParA family protein [Planctomycetes bacterium]|nr:MinD/ParA family protein [Planctomycetota bacterium]